MTISDAAHRNPGMMPPRNNSPIEVLEMTPYRTMVMLGGTSGPIIEEAAVTEPENSSS